MNREIKFIAWLKKEKKMIEVREINFASEQILFETEDECLYGFSFDEIELLQYVGIKDKNSIEIYDGYILQDEQGRKFVIEYKFGGFNLVPIEYYNDEFSWNAMGNMQCAGFIRDCCEIIGNVYQNKELLGNEKED